MMTKNRYRVIAICLIVLIIIAAALYIMAEKEEQHENQHFEEIEQVLNYPSVSDYTGEAYTVLNGNIPDFTQEDYTTVAYEFYSELDSLKRCGYAEACVGQELMPTEKRGNISQVKPSGWNNAEYDIVDGKHLYNRCHLIGYQLSGENANAKNLITGTRYLNVQGMLPFENMVADYVKETGNHVLYRVTPIFDGDNLVANGVQMEAWSVEDDGEGICFNIFAYNVQPGIEIDYSDGASRLEAGSAGAEDEEIYVLNTNTKKFHRPDCKSAIEMNVANKSDYKGSRSILIAQGYEPCSRCSP